MLPSEALVKTALAKGPCGHRQKNLVNRNPDLEVAFLRLLCCLRLIVYNALHDIFSNCAYDNAAFVFEQIPTQFILHDSQGLMEAPGDNPGVMIKVNPQIDLGEHGQLAVAAQPAIGTVELGHARMGGEPYGGGDLAGHHLHVRGHWPGATDVGVTEMPVSIRLALFVAAAAFILEVAAGTGQARVLLQLSVIR